MQTFFHRITDQTEAKKFAGYRWRQTWPAASYPETRRIGKQNGLSSQTATARSLVRSAWSIATAPDTLGHANRESEKKIAAPSLATGKRPVPNPTGTRRGTSTKGTSTNDSQTANARAIGLAGPVTRKFPTQKYLRSTSAVAGWARSVPNGRARPYLGPIVPVWFVSPRSSGSLPTNEEAIARLIPCYRLQIRSMRQPLRARRHGHGARLGNRAAGPFLRRS